jgi:Holliday junction resolvasome RuvABC endonuclease subunit
MLAIGIDCATRTGWAVVESVCGREHPLEHGIVDASKLTPAELCQAMDRVLNLSACNGHNDVVVALELPFLDKNPHVLEVLARLCGQWEHACAMRGLDAVLVRASRWQPAILTGLIDTHSKREQRKRAARMWCKATYGVDLSDDESDAAAIATWACRQHRARATGLIR